MIAGEVFFRAGIAIMAASLLLGFAGFLIWKVKGKKLEKTLNMEYGAVQKHRKPHFPEKQENKG